MEKIIEANFRKLYFKNKLLPTLSINITRRNSLSLVIRPKLVNLKANFLRICKIEI